MRQLLLAVLCGLSPLSAQDLVVNYLGGVAAGGSSFAAPVTGPASLAVSADGQKLYVAQFEANAVLRYDLAAKTVDRIAVPQMAGASPVPTGMVVQSDGTLLVPVKNNLARIELDGRVTIPGYTFPLNNGRNPLQNVSGTSDLQPPAALAQSPGRFSIVTLRSTSFAVWLVTSSFTNPAGNTGSICTVSSFNCDNSKFVSGTSAQLFRPFGPWTIANAADGTVYFADAGLGIIGGIGLNQNLTILGSPTTTAIPMGTSNTRLSKPSGIVRDNAGNLLIADTGNQRILQRTPADIWSVYAGTGTRGNSGNGGLANKAQLAEPGSLALDAGGTLYFHDQGNTTLRRILPNGVIESVTQNNTADSPSINSTSFPAVTALAADSVGNLFVAAANRIYRIDGQGTVLAVAGTGQSGVGGENVPAAETPADRPTAMTVDSGGRLLFSEFSNFRVRRIEKSGLVSTIAGNQKDTFGAGDGDLSPATQAALGVISGLAIDKDNSLLLSGIHRIRRVRNDGIIVPAAGMDGCDGYGDGLPAVFVCSGIAGGLAALEGGGFAFTTGSALRVVDADGFITTAASGKGLQFGSVITAPNGLLYALGQLNNSGNSVLYSISLQSGKITALTQPGYQATKPPGQAADQTQLSGPIATPLAIDARGLLYLPDPNNQRILVIGSPVEVTVQTEPAGLPVRVDGVRVTAPQLFRWLPGDYHNVEADATAGDLSFDSWSHGQGSKVTWLPAGTTTVTARYR